VFSQRGAARPLSSRHAREAGYASFSGMPIAPGTPKAAIFRATSTVDAEVCGASQYRPARRAAFRRPCIRPRWRCLERLALIPPRPRNACRRSLLWGKGGGVENRLPRAEANHPQSFCGLGQQGSSSAIRTSPAQLESGLFSGVESGSALGAATHGTVRGLPALLAASLCQPEEFTRNHHGEQIPRWVQPQQGCHQNEQRQVLPQPEQRHRLGRLLKANMSLLLERQDLLREAAGGSALRKICGHLIKKNLIYFHWLEKGALVCTYYGRMAGTGTSQKKLAST